MTLVTAIVCDLQWLSVSVVYGCCCPLSTGNSLSRQKKCRRSLALSGCYPFNHHHRCFTVVLTLFIAGVDWINNWLVYGKIWVAGLGANMAENRWYVIKAVSGREDRALQNIQIRIGQAGLKNC